MSDGDCPIHAGRTPMPENFADLPLAAGCYCTTCLTNMIEVRPDRGLRLADSTPVAQRGLLVCPKCGEEWIESRPTRHPCAICLSGMR